MDIIDKKTDEEILQSIIAEVSKATNELKCAKGDIEKAQNRIKFINVLTHKLIERQGD